MSWSIEEHIGEGRPWPEQVVVYRGETDESLTYARRSLSDVNKMVELMDTLAAENAKLREQVDAAHMSRLLTENENESLRELCGFMLRCMKRNHDCDCCLVNGEHCEISYIESDARELGVEVDG